MEEQTKKIKEHNIDEKTTETFRKELKDINDKLNKIDIDEFTFDDWYSKGTNEYYNGDKNKAIKYFEKSIRLETNDTNLSKAFFFMGYIYKDELKDNENAIKYYKMAIEKEHVGAMYNLALLYEEELKDNENVIKYYKMAIEKEDARAMNNLALLYQQELKENENAIKYYKMSIEKEHVDAMYNLALLYEQELKDNENAEKYYKMYEEYKNAEENE